jgi:transcription antitermination factor NusG
MNTEIIATGTISTISETLTAVECSCVPVEYYEAGWYAAHTSANHEKRVVEQLGLRNVEHFLPLYESTRQRRNGRVTLQLPLFPGYVFIRIPLREKLRVQQIPGVARLVGFVGHPSIIADDEIDALKKLMDSGIRAEPFPYLTVGKRIRICAGPLAGREGIVVRRKGGPRVVLSIHLVQRAVLVDVDVDALEPLRSARHYEHRPREYDHSRSD